MTLKETFTFFFICSALIITSFILQIGAYPLLSDTVLDYRSTKEFLAIVFTSWIVLWAFYSGHKIKCTNPGIIVLLGYLLIHPFLTPIYDLQLFNQNIAGFWQYKPVFYSLIYFLFFCVVSNLNLKDEHYQTFFKVFYWIGFISALYALLQHINLDEFQHLASWGNAPATPQGNMTATFTHPNYSGAFIALTIPFAIYLRRLWQAILMFITLLIINGKMALFGCVIGIGTISFYKNKWNTIILAFLVVIFGIVLMQHHPDDWTDSGRFGMWKLLFHDITHPWIANKAFPLFGHGLGSFGTIWTTIHQGAMHEAHNEYLQYWFDAGLVGLGLLIFSIFWLIKQLKVLIIADSQIVTLMACFMCISGCSIGLFMWQIEPHRFMSVLIFGLLHNKINQHRGIKQ